MPEKTTAYGIDLLGVKYVTHTPTAFYSKNHSYASEVSYVADTIIDLDSGVVCKQRAALPEDYLDYSNAQVVTPEELTAISLARQPIYCRQLNLAKALIAVARGEV